MLDTSLFLYVYLWENYAELYITQARALLHSRISSVRGWMTNMLVGGLSVQENILFAKS
jgi:hypothetical protein